MNNIYLIGFMGAGKSTVARRLEELTGAQRIEMDQRIEEQQKEKITDIFSKYGEEYFRDLETELLKSLVKQQNLIVSCGGGSVLRDENARLMKEAGRIILLSATAETVYERVKHSTNRPILNGNMSVEYIRELLEKRRARYESVADEMIVTDQKTVEQICEEIRGKAL
ncbi:MAG: shikimate kinase [Clostridiales bacterium]|nr:shikimate kinase [Clostridiales bacterium]